MFKNLSKIIFKNVILSQYLNSLFPQSVSIIIPPKTHFLRILVIALKKKKQFLYVLYKRNVFHSNEGNIKKHYLKEVYIFHFITYQFKR